MKGLLILLISSLVAASMANAALLVIPTVPTDFSIVDPDSSVNITQPFRLQQIIDKSLFASTGPILLQSVSFRADRGQSFTFSGNLELKLSTTTTSVASFSGISSTGQVQVFNGSFSQAMGGTVQVPQPFHLTFNFTTPYAYNPATENLQLDFQFSSVSAPSSSAVDAVAFNDYTRVISSKQSPEAVPIIQLGFTAIPEPFTGALVILGGMGMVFGIRRRKSSAL